MSATAPRIEDFDVRDVSIIEQPSADAWLIEDEFCWCLAPTAADALAAVKQRDRTRAEFGGRPVISIITWEPRTSIGASVVKALTGR